MSESMINIGCDIGKSNLEVYIEGRYNQYKNNKSGISAFIKRCSLLEGVRVVLEPSGGYEQRLLETLHRQKIQVSVNPYYVRNFARSFRDLA